jgi:hypothetical protein
MRNRTKKTTTPTPERISNGIAAARQHPNNPQPATPAAKNKTAKNPKGAGRKSTYAEPMKSKAFMLPIFMHEEIQKTADKHFTGNVSALAREAIQAFLIKLNKKKSI